MSDKELEKRVGETVKVNASEVVAKPLDVKEYPKVAYATEEEKDKALEESTIGEWREDDADAVGDEGGVPSSS